jgi:hypothetical protein
MALAVGVRTKSLIALLALHSSPTHSLIVLRLSTTHSLIALHLSTTHSLIGLALQSEPELFPYTASQALETELSWHEKNLAMNGFSLRFVTWQHIGQCMSVARTLATGSISGSTLVSVCHSPIRCAVHLVSSQILVGGSLTPSPRQASCLPGVQWYPPSRWLTSSVPAPSLPPLADFHRANTQQRLGCRRLRNRQWRRWCRMRPWNAWTRYSDKK